MTTHQQRDATSPKIYPARYFQASRTYDTWVRLSCADVHALRQVSGFEGQHILFHGNHPIRFVRITGPIVSITDLSTRFTLLALDDSSGRTIEVKIPRLPPEIADLPECPSNTVVDNLSIRSNLGIFDVLIDEEIADIGTVVSAKGVMCEFRGVRQLELKRIRIVKTTAEEVQLWTDMAKFKRDVLSKPWDLNPQERNRLDMKALVEQERERRKQKEKQAYYRKKAEKKKAFEARMGEKLEKYERRRVKEEHKMNEGALL